MRRSTPRIRSHRRKGRLRNPSHCGRSEWPLSGLRDGICGRHQEQEWAHSRLAELQRTPRFQANLDVGFQRCGLIGSHLRRMAGICPTCFKPPLYCTAHQCRRRAESVNSLQRRSTAAMRSLLTLQSVAPRPESDFGQMRSESLLRALFTKCCGLHQCLLSQLSADQRTLRDEASGTPIHEVSACLETYGSRAS